MQSPEPAVWSLQCVGIVHRADPVNRELAVIAEGALLTFDVPVNCEITLHGERVRFRMVQPRDRVRITHARRDGSLVALGIDAEPAG